MSELEIAVREKRRVALTSVGAAVFLTGMKFVIGWTTGSLGILSEAAHSGLDLVAALATLFAVRASGLPADREHTYGHGKYESLSALFEMVLLLITCAWIMSEAVNRLLFHHVDVQVNAWSFLVILVSIAVDFSRSRALMRAANKYKSQALEADAIHFSTDIWSSGVVLLGLGIVLFANVQNYQWLTHADSVAALLVALIVIRISMKLGKKTLNELLDAIPADLVEKVTRASKVDGVSGVKRARVRRSGPSYFADVTLLVPRDLPLSEAHRVARRAEVAIQKQLPGADVVVQVDPDGRTHETTIGRIREIAARHGLGAHAIALSKTGDSGSIEMHLEVDQHLRVAEAHAQVSTFEKELHLALPSFAAITTHIEPLPENVELESSAGRMEEKKVKEILHRLAHESRLTFEPHDLEIRREEGKLAVIFHCACDGRVSITEAHNLTAKLEDRLRHEMPQIGRVVIHVEPMEDVRKT